MFGLMLPIYIIVGFCICRIVFHVLEFFLKQSCRIICIQGLSRWLDSTEEQAEESELEQSYLDFQNSLHMNIFEQIIRQATTISKIKSNFGHSNKRFEHVIFLALENLIMKGIIGVYPGGILYYENTFNPQTLIEIYDSKGLYYFVLWLLEGLFTRTLRAVQGLNRWFELSKIKQCGCLPEDGQPRSVDDDRLSPIGVMVRSFEKEVDSTLINVVVNNELTINNMKDIVAKHDDLLERCVQIVLEEKILRGEVGVYPGGKIYYERSRFLKLPKRQDQNDAMLLNAKEEFENAVEAEINRQTRNCDVSLKEFRSRIVNNDARIENYIDLVIHRIILKGNLSIYPGKLIYHSPES